MNSIQTLLEYGVHIPHILLPAKNVDLKKWAVIACDQYTQDSAYWDTVRDFVGDDKSTVHITFPEIYLEDENRFVRINGIRQKMAEYVHDASVFALPFTGMIYVERATPFERMRKGLITAVDLERYDWKPHSQALIRATEATIVERIPPRMEIRRNAPLEVPHIMLLVNDPDNTLIQKPETSVRDKPLYDTDLMCNSGHISGWAVHSEDEFERIADSLKSLAEKSMHMTAIAAAKPFLFAVGDGNHSLATAKAVWEEYKALHAGEADIDTHPARYALVEIVNLYDEGLTFEPIHRVLFNTVSEAVIAFLQTKLMQNEKSRVFECKNAEELTSLVAQSAQLHNRARFGFVSQLNNIEGACGARVRYMCLETGVQELAVNLLQPLLDEFIIENPAVKIDYIHGSEEVFRLGQEENVVSLMLPPIAKDNFFAAIAKGVPLPRKSFSMGEADEKRFYFECRKLF